MDSFVSDVNESMLASESQLKVFEVQELFSSPDEVRFIMVYCVVSDDCVFPASSNCIQIKQEVILVDEFRQLIQQDTFLHIVKKVCAYSSGRN